MDFFSKDTKSALEAIDLAQWIAFAPVVFQASLALRDLGILERVAESKLKGLTLSEIEEKTNLPHYGVRVLAEAGLGIGLLLQNQKPHILHTHPVLSAKKLFLTLLIYLSEIVKENVRKQAWLFFLNWQRVVAS